LRALKGVQMPASKEIRIAVLVSEGFEPTNLEQVLEELRSAGGSVELLTQLDPSVDPARYAGVLIPGGALSVDRMRASRQHLAFVRNIYEADKPVAALGHAGWLLADSGIARGHTLTSAPTIQKDLERAGAIWKDRPIVEEGNLATAQTSEELPKLLQIFWADLRKTADQRMAG
jgi:protease I